MAAAIRIGDISPTPAGPVTLEDVKQMLNRNISEVMNYYEHASDNAVADKILEAVQRLLSHLSAGRPASASGPASVTESPDDPETLLSPLPSHLPSRKRRRSPPEAGDEDLSNHPVASPQLLRVGKGRKSRASAPKHPREHRKPSLSTLAISRECGASEISQIRAKFQTDLVQLTTTTRREGQAPTTSFSVDEANELTEFFFDEVMGPQSLQRLIGLVRAYSPTDDDNHIDAGALVRLKKIAHDKHAPLVIRRFFGTFHHHQRLHNTNPVMLHLQQIIESRELLLNYERVRANVEEGDTETITYLTRRGMTVGVGRGWSSVAIDFLADQVQIKRTTFVNMCERAKGINTLVDHFGEGILPLLPPGAMHKLRKYGSQRMTPAYELLQKCVTSFRPICDLTKDHVYLPFARGDPALHLDVSHLADPQSNTLIDIISEAVTIDAGHLSDKGEV